MSPSCRSERGRVLAIARIAESGVAFIGIGRDGRKNWEWVRNTAEMYAVAGGDRHGYFAFSYAGKPYLGRLDPETGEQVEFSSGQRDLPLSGPATALAVRKQVVAVAIQGEADILILDAESGHRTGTIAASGTAHLAFAPDGRVVGLTARGEIFIATPGKADLERFRLEGVAPQAITCDGNGRLYVSDRTSATVKIFDRLDRKAKLVGTVGVPGGRRPGPFDPARMAVPRSLAIDESPDGNLSMWCVEDIYHPRRVAVWDVTNPGSTRLLREYIGGTDYCGSGGLLSDDVPELGIVSGTMFHVDYEATDYRPLQVMGGRPDPLEGKTALFHVGAFPGMFGNGYHFFSDASGTSREYYVEGHGVSMVFMRRGDRWHCVAAIGHRKAGVPFPPEYPSPHPGWRQSCLPVERPERRWLSGPGGADLALRTILRARVAQPSRRVGGWYGRRPEPESGPRRLDMR